MGSAAAGARGMDIKNSEWNVYNKLPGQGPDSALLRNECKKLLGAAAAARVFPYHIIQDCMMWYCSSVKRRGVRRGRGMEKEKSGGREVEK